MAEKKQEKTSIIERHTEALVNFMKHYSFLKQNGLTKKLLIQTILFRILTSVLSVVSIGLLLPLTKGIISRDFEFVINSKYYLTLSEYIPIISNFGYIHIFLILAFFIFLATTLKNVFLYFGDMSLTKQRLRIATNTSEYIFKNYLRLGQPFYDNSEGTSESFFFLKFGKLIKQLLDGFDKIIDVLIQFISLSTLMIFISFKLYLAALLLLPVILAINFKLKNNIHESAKQEMEGEMNFPIAVNNSFSRLPLTFINNYEKKEQKTFMSTCLDFEGKMFKQQKKMSLINPINEIVILILLLIASAFLGFLSYNTLLDAAKAMVFFFSFKQFISIGKQIFSSYFSIIRPTMLIERSLKVIKKGESNKVITGTKKFAGLKEKISIKNLTYSYPGSKRKILKGVNLTIKKGEITAIIGRSGSGKSTLSTLLLRLYDCPKDTIFLDGVDIKEYTLDSIRKYFTIIGQDTILFKDTIYENVIYGAKRKIPHSEVESILRSLKLDKLVSGKQGVSSKITQNGINISGGEKQRIGLARALLNDSELIILDEPTSSLDSLTEEEIRIIIDKYTKNKTLIVIAHRLNTIRNSHKVAVMEDGAIVEKGTISTLLKKKGIFYNYWNLQGLREK